MALCRLPTVSVRIGFSNVHVRISVLLLLVAGPVILATIGVNADRPFSQCQNNSINCAHRILLGILLFIILLGMTEKLWIFILERVALTSPSVLRFSVFCVPNKLSQLLIAFLDLHGLCQHVQLVRIASSEDIAHRLYCRRRPGITIFGTIRAVIW